MPHHESGLLGLKTNDPTVIDRAARFFRKVEPDHAIEIVRVAKGKGVVLTFGSVLKPPDHRRNVDVSLFQNDKALASLAKSLKQRIWVGFAIGGYSNSQLARAFSPEGKLEWSSSYRFDIPPSMRQAFGDPFTSAEERHELVLRARRENGYGLIGEALGFDYFRILDVNAGDALFAKEKRRLGTSAIEHAAWLEGRFRAPEGEPGDGAEPASPVQRLLFRASPATKALAPALSASLAELSTRRGLPAAGVRLVTREKKGKSECVVSGPAVKALSSTLCDERFVGLVRALSRAEGLFVFGQQPKQEARLLYAMGGASVPEMFSARLEQPDLDAGTWKGVELRMTQTLKKEIATLTAESIRELDDDDEDGRWTVELA